MKKDLEYWIIGIGVSIIVVSFMLLLLKWFNITTQYDDLFTCQGIYQSLDHLEYYSTGHKNLTETYLRMDCDTIYRVRSDDYFTGY